MTVMTVTTVTVITVGLNFQATLYLLLTSQPLNGITSHSYHEEPLTASVISCDLPFSGYRSRHDRQMNGCSAACSRLCEKITSSLQQNSTLYWEWSWSNKQMKKLKV